ncbi:MAG: hypothetical protein IPK00_14535 [Deltaproteobacteria bacterium]|nr:hypothetical protein [Deltaproteobacteria bacterium]
MTQRDPKTKNGASWDAQAMLELGTRHGQLEAEGKLDLVMETLVADPIFEFWPVGLRMRGRDQVRRFYEHLIGTFYGEQKSYRLIEEWLSERSLAQEYEMVVQFDTGLEAHRVIGILFEKDGLLGGERIWGSKALLKKMIGPVWDELEQIGD